MSLVRRVLGQSHQTSVRAFRRARQ
jgi:hypothetical protein